MMVYKSNHNDYHTISKRLANQNVLIEFVPNSPTSIMEGVFAKGKLNPRDQQDKEDRIFIRLKINGSEIEVPFEDIKSIHPLNKIYFV